MSGKRQGYISWDEYFMGVAELSGMRSKDPNSQGDPVLSARTIKSFLWDIMGSQWAAQMMNSPGPGKGGV